MNEQYAETMETDTGHIVVAIRDLGTTDLSLGRAPDGEYVGVLNADIRAGRSLDQRRTLANAVIERFGEQFDIPTEHCYVFYSEHPGEDFHLEEGAMDSWSDTEADRD